MGHTSSGTFVIDPDGQGGQPPVSVECDMADPPVTIIHHDREDTISILGYHVPHPGVMPIPITYAALTYQNIRSIISSSESCSYHIQVEHHKVRLTGYSYWKSYEGEKVEWADSTDTMCQGMLKRAFKGTSPNRHLKDKSRLDISPRTCPDSCSGWKVQKRCPFGDVELGGMS